MRIINAHWEEKNTHLKTCEIIFGKNDNISDYKRSQIESEYKFSVVKIPIGNLQLIHQLENLNYRYLENQLLLTFDVYQTENINPKWERLLKDFTYKLILTKDELNSVLVEVSHKMFETDRFSMDPFWKDDLSSIRYQNWIKELFESGTAQFYVIVKDGKEMGFFSIMEEPNSIKSCPIAGIYNKYKSSGYIFVLTWFWLLEGRKLGCKKLTTSISSNNRIMLSSISKVFSFSIRDAYIVLRKVIK